MTEQEAEEFAARLGQIWSCLISWRRDEYGYPFSATICGDVRFNCYVSHGYTTQQFIMGRLIEGELLGGLMCHSDKGMIVSSTEVIAGRRDKYPALSAQFAEQWMDFFRHGCWLSGCPVEASAHEKAQWSQGFTSEELQAWNLKM